MFLKHVPTDDLVEVLDLSDVANPRSQTVRARSYDRVLIERTRNYLKTELAFPSGEPLPECWLSIHYHERKVA